jgi:hypothetical protein
MLEFGLLKAAAMFAMAQTATQPASGRTIFVSPSGRSDAPGSEKSPLASLPEALKLVKGGDVIRLAPGTYKHDKTIFLEAKWTAEAPVTIECAGPERALFDFSAQTEDKKNSHAFNIPGDYWNIIGIEAAFSGAYGFWLNGSHNIIRYCNARQNRNSGMQMDDHASYNLFDHCQSFRNFDPKTFGEDADGFTAKHQIGPGNVMRHCFSYQNSDDGFDFWMSPHPVLLEDCIAYRNGYNLWPIFPFEGDGNGFKFGGNYVPCAHVCRRCISIENPLYGFDQNHNMGPLTIEDCLAIRCGKGFFFSEDPQVGPCVVRNCTSFGCQNVLATGVVSENNHWYPDVPTGVMGPLPRPGHRDVAHAGQVPTQESVTVTLPPNAPEWGYPADTPPIRDPRLPGTGVQPSVPPTLKI